MDETFVSLLENLFNENAVLYFDLSYINFTWSILKIPCHIRNSNSADISYNALLKFISLVASKTNGVNDPVGLKLLMRLRVGFSRLREQKFKPSFNLTLNPLRYCRIGTGNIHNTLLSALSFL